MEIVEAPEDNPATSRRAGAVLGPAGAVFDGGGGAVGGHNGVVRVTGGAGRKAERGTHSPLTWAVQSREDPDKVMLLTNFEDSAASQTEQFRQVL